MAFGDHGEVADFLPADGGDADEVIGRFEAEGVDLDALAARLQSEGADAFVTSWNELLRGRSSRSRPRSRGAGDGARRSAPGRPGAPSRSTTGQLAGRHLRELFAEDPGRGERLTAEGAGLFLDYSKNRITDETLALLIRAGRGVRPARAHRRDVPRRRDQRHRGPRGAARGAAGAPGRADRGRRRGRRRRPSTRCSTGWRRSPSACAAASGPGTPASRSATSSTSASAARTSARSWPTRRCGTTARRDMTFRFVSNVDGTDFVEATRDLDPAETLFIVSSKTFTTLETMTNARTARDWSLARAAATRRPSPSTSWPCRRTSEGVREFGIDPANMFGFWDWVGGRYSMDSAIGLSTMIADRARGASGRCSPASTPWTSTSARRPFERNLPVLMGLLAVWYGDFFGAQTVGRAALRPVPGAVPGLPAAAHDGVERQARDPRRERRSTTRPAPSTGASRAPTGSTPSTSSSTRARS